MIGLGRIEIEIVCDAPLRIGGDGVDVRRDMSGRPCIPASALKGRVRAEVERLCRALCRPCCTSAAPCRTRGSVLCDICTLFGAKDVEGQVYFADLTADSAPILLARSRSPQSWTRGVTIQRESIRLLALPVGTHFSGTLRHRLAEADKQKLGLFITGLRAIDQIGAGSPACESRLCDRLL